MDMGDKVTFKNVRPRDLNQPRLVACLLVEQLLACQGDASTPRLEDLGRHWPSSLSGVTLSLLNMPDFNMPDFASQRGHNRITTRHSDITTAWRCASVQWRYLVRRLFCSAA
jgi:hypothetical protein